MSDDTTDQLEFVRLHITPFNSALLDKIIAPSLQPLAKNISFHTIQTFPEQGFGYVELPKMEAQKLKTKLNGSTLKGAKVKIEEAKPEKKRKSDDEGDGEDRKARKAAKKEKKRQEREEGVIPGHELEEGRQIKRGWTEDGAKSKGSKKKHQSQDTDTVEGKRLRFKATVSPIVTPTEAKHKDKAKHKKEREKDGKKHKKITVVEEFTNSTKPSTSTHVRIDSHHALNYEDGKGWVDDEGNVVEAERDSERRRRSKSARSEESRISAIESREEANDETKTVPTEPPEGREDDEMSVDGANGDDHPNTSSLNYADEEDADVTPTSTSVKEVHPLEALFKRPTSAAQESSKQRPKPIDTGFSFFDAEAASENGEMETAMPPQTPRTKSDIEWRSIRSAAPTPDTAAIGRHFSFPFGRSDDEDEDDIEEGAADEDVEMDDGLYADRVATQAGESGQGEESAFRKWFYENRGDFNRGWKKRRREERKVKRQRDNRRLSRKVA